MVIDLSKSNIVNCMKILKALKTNRVAIVRTFMNTEKLNPEYIIIFFGEICSLQVMMNKRVYEVNMKRMEFKRETCCRGVVLKMWV